ncbi:MAG TPA: CdaR family protein [Bryobacteraceae bacterium]|nr:CdaR family protein [Bryobacteraceae bacterium]
MRSEVENFARSALRLIAHNFLWKLAALAGAVAIWALVASEPELSTFTTVRIEFRNLPPEMEIGNTPMDTVTLELRGRTGALARPGERRPSVVLNMADVTPGLHTYEIGDGNLTLPPGVHLVHAFPSEVRLDLEPRATREIPVQVQFANQSGHSYVVAGYTVSPEQLEIEGPAGHVARVSAALTDPVTPPQVPGTAQLRVTAYVEDQFVQFVSFPQVTVTVTMKEGPAPANTKEPAAANRR